MKRRRILAAIIAARIINHTRYSALAYCLRRRRDNDRNCGPAIADLREKAHSRLCVVNDRSFREHKADAFNSITSVSWLRGSGGLIG